MSDAIRDENFVPVKLGVLYSDGVTTVPVAVDSTSGGMVFNYTNTISYTPTPVGVQDKNFVNVLLAQGTDGLAYPINVDATGAVLASE